MKYLIFVIFFFISIFSGCHSYVPIHKQKKSCHSFIPLHDVPYITSYAQNRMHTEIPSAYKKKRSMLEKDQNQKDHTALGPIGPTPD